MTPAPRRLLLDSSAIIDFFDQTPKGEKVRKVKDNAELFCSAISHHELMRKITREHLPDERRKLGLELLAAMVQTVDVTSDIAVRAAVIRERHPRLHMADSLILASAQTIQAALVTCDNDFRQNHVDEVELITIT